MLTQEVHMPTRKLRDLEVFPMVMVQFQNMQKPLDSFKKPTDKDIHSLIQQRAMQKDIMSS